MERKRQLPDCHLHLVQVAIRLFKLICDTGERRASVSEILRDRIVDTERTPTLD